VQRTEISIDERVPRLGLVRGSFREPEMPVTVLVPGVGREERVFGCTVGLDVAPVAVEDGKADDRAELSVKVYARD
jgi:hypothetical protein